MAVNNATLHRVWRGLLDSILGEDNKNYDFIPKVSKQIRSMSMSRLREQLWYALDEAEGGWAYPIDIFVGDNGTDLFSIVAQQGKLYQVPLTVSQEKITLGEWVQVKEEFTPTTQTRNNFSIRRQKDGRYRWLAIAGTTVLNRVGEIDSSDLFDSFIKRAEKTGKYPRLDFYHLGETNPDMWEFGTADYLAREGVCYIASGLFDEDHPLAKAAIRACADDTEGLWGNSIEFYAYVEPEIVLADPEVRIPVYKDGENTRISMVLEEDAAGLFTRIGVLNEEVKRAMDETTKAKLSKLFGEDSAELEKFIEGFEGNVDGVNRTVLNDKLIHRAKGEEAPAAEKKEETEQEQEEEGDVLVLDDEAIAAITQQMVQTDVFKQMSQGINDIKSLVAEVVAQRSKDVEEISNLKRAVGNLGKEEDEKKTEWMQDLPSRSKRTVVTHRPGNAHKQDDVEVEESSTDIAKRTLARIPKAAQY